MTNPLALIIEDDEKLANIFSLALQAAEFSTEIVRDGYLALARLAEATPIIVILDLHLPTVSGEDILAKIRADDRLSQTQVIVTTADALMGDDLRDRADFVLLKPVSVNQLTQLAMRLRPSDATFH